MKSDLGVELGGLGRLESPVLLSSGTFGTATPYLKMLQDQPVGAVCTKTITPLPKNGNPQPRILEGPSSLINSIGLENPGIDAFVRGFEREYASLPFVHIVSISANSPGEFVYLVERLNELRTPRAIELNLSCPNVDSEGLAFGNSPEKIGSVVHECARISRFPLVAKLSPFQSIDPSFALAAQEGGAAALALINTIPAMVLDIHQFRSALGTLSGGLSGPAIRPVALKMVYEISHAVHIPVIGMGGISSGEDAIEFLMAGASAVSLGTMNLVKPTLPSAICACIHDFLVEHEMENVGEISRRFDGLQSPREP
ncbi:MAG TPA: dihydroorotate dehydrogenase [Thermotogota bacterium]|nr:dihydroorotate dehydrogenase [Thermotogota bacterium]